VSRRFLLINPRSGNGSPSPEELADAARRYGVEPHFLRDGEDPGDLARRSGASILGMAGGDGSLAAVADAAIETGAAFVCVPFGTRNHFARDAGYDRDDPLGALAAFAGGAERTVDAGRVNGRLFLNNVSLGVYARLVHRRERHRRRREALARLRALGALARNRHRLHAVVDGEPVAVRVLLVGNNRYELAGFTVGARERLDEGVLQLLAAGGVLPTTWEGDVAARFRIELPGRSVGAAIDGEPVELDTPLELESAPGALRLLLPGTSASSHDTEEEPMHDNPRPTEEEQEHAQTSRQQEEESMRGMEHHDPDEQSRRSGADDEE
jgi:diacylglycerol kinase family enzyme